MRKLFASSLVLFIAVVSILSCNPKEKSTIPETTTTSEAVTKSSAEVKPGFVHAVYFWLKKDNPALLDEFIKKGLPKLAKVSSIQSVSWGPPAGTPREVVDNTYDLAWIVSFTSPENQDKYQVDPIHLEFVEKYKSLFERVQVYDNIVSNYEAN